MDFIFFLNGIKNVLLNPVKFYETVYSGSVTTKVVRNSLFLPLVFLVCLSAFFGSLLFSNTELSPVYSVLILVRNFVLIVFTVYISSILLKEITFPFDLGREMAVSSNLIMISITPFLLCQIITRLFESFLFVNILGLYSLYIFWVGAEKLLNPPNYKKMPLLIAVFILFAEIYIGTDMVLRMLTDRFYFAVIA